MRRLGIIVAAAAALVGGMSVSSCGSASTSGIAKLSASAILSKAVKALRSASSMRITGSSQQGKSSTKLDLKSYANGDLDGTIEVDGIVAHFIVVKKTDYIKAPAAYWTKIYKLGQRQASAMSKTWVSLPDSETSQGAELSIPGIATSITQGIGTIHQGSTGTINGQSAISITSTHGGTIWVAASGPAYPIQLVLPGGNAGTGTFNFGDWNKFTPPTAPAHSKPSTDFAATPPSSAHSGSVSPTIPSAPSGSIPPATGTPSLPSGTSTPPLPPTSPATGAAGSSSQSSPAAGTSSNKG
ncbi:MAG: hypothetical protein M0020_06840 [Actinomycetota bacterium]|nr:hypothetical protein [Actinomycetota bacterium]